MSKAQVRKTLKYRMYEHKRNRYLHQRIDCAGIAWNHITALQKTLHRASGKYASKYAVMKHMAKLRRADSVRFQYLKNIDAQALQDICTRHDNAYQRFFKWVKNRKGRRAGPPRFKPCKKYKSFTLKQTAWNYLGDNKVRIGQHNYKFSLSRPVEGTIKTVTIKRDNLNRLWICFSVIQDVEIEETSTGHIGGFDFGLKTFLTDHDGNAYVNPQFFNQMRDDIATCNRALARKHKGSSGWHRARLDLARAHRRVANKRRDYHWKLAHQLTDAFDILRFEDLNLAGMKKLWGRKVSDLGFYNFMLIIAYVARMKGKTVEKIDRWNPTSQCCSQCGQRQDMHVRIRTFVCERCDFVCDRDKNAAINIQAGGASPAGLGNVSRPRLDAIPA